MEYSLPKKSSSTCSVTISWILFLQPPTRLLPLSDKVRIFFLGEGMNVAVLLDSWDKIIGSLIIAYWSADKAKLLFYVAMRWDWFSLKRRMNLSGNTNSPHACPSWPFKMQAQCRLYASLTSCLSYYLFQGWLDLLIATQVSCLLHFSDPSSVEWDEISSYGVLITNVS